MKRKHKSETFQCFILIKCHPPDPLSAPKVHCRCVSYPYVTLCSWPEPSHSPPTNYVATYR